MNIIYVIGTVAALLQEIVKIYPNVTPPNLTVSSFLSLFQVHFTPKDFADTIYIYQDQLYSAGLFKSLTDNVFVLSMYVTNIFILFLVTFCK